MTGLDFIRYICSAGSGEVGSPLRLPVGRAHFLPTRPPVVEDPWVVGTARAAWTGGIGQPADHPPQATRVGSNFPPQEAEEAEPCALPPFLLLPPPFTARSCHRSRPLPH